MKEELKKEIGARLRRIRKTLGYTQEKMVSHFEIGRANYSRIEKGEVWPGVSILFTLQTKFNVSLDWLITNSGKMFIREWEKKGIRKKVDFGEYSDEIKELLLFINRVPMVKHAMLSYFLEYRIRHHQIIEHVLEENDLSLKLNAENQ